MADFIDDPSAYMKVQLYTGDGSVQAITFDDTATDMTPDLVWIKNRDQEDHHCWFDTIRGVTKLVLSSDDAMQSTDADTLTVFGSDGFTVGADVKVNTNTEKYVAWCWKAGTTGTDLSAGGITPSSSSINTTTGFGIYAYNSTGSATTIAHGLGKIPELIICRQLTSGASETARDWPVYHHKNTSAPETDYLKLNSISATADALLWNDTAHTSTLFNIGGGAEVNQVSGTYVAYVFTSIPGFSRIGSYYGNGNADAPYIYLGFRPKFLIIKSTASNNWILWDNERNPINEGTHCALTPNGVAVDNCNTGYLVMDFYSNGFKYTDTNAIANTSGQNYVYIAFAHSPFANSSGVPCNAK